MASKKIKGITIELGAETKGLDKALSGVEKESRSLSSELREVEQLLKFNPENTVALEQKQQLLAKQIQNTADKLDILKNAESQVQDQFEKGDIKEEQYRAFQREIVKTESQLAGLERKIDGIDDSKAPKNAKDDISKIGDESGNVEDEVSSMGDVIAGDALQGIADKAQEVVDKFVELGAAAYEAAIESGDSYVQLQAALGLTQEETKELANVANEVFKNGVVDSVEEATHAVQIAYQNFGYLNDVELTDLVNQVTALAEVTGWDVSDAMLTAQKAMVQFKISEEEAFDLLAGGFQSGLDSSDDFLDTMKEYGGLFKDAGFSAEEMLAVLEQGMLNGSLNTDKTADAVKELQLAFGDGRFEESVENFSNGTQGLFAKWQKGEVTMSEVMQSIAADMNKMTPVEQQESLSLLTTQFEDLGIDATLAILGVKGGLEGLEGSLDEVSQKKPGQMIASSLRELQDLLSPLGAALMALVNGGLQALVFMLQNLVTWFNGLNPVIQSVIQFLGIFTSAFVVLLPVVMTTIGAITALQGILAFIPVTLSSILAPIALVAAAIGVIILAFKNWDSIIRWLNGVLSVFGTSTGEIFNAIKNVITSVVSSISSFVMSIWGTLVAWWNENNQMIKTIAVTVWNVISTIIKVQLSVISSYMQAVWTGIVNIVRGVWETIKIVVSTALNTVLGVVKSVMQLLTGNWKGAWNTLRQTVVGAGAGILSAVSSTFKNVLNAIVTPIQIARDTVAGIVSKIKSLFNFTIKFPSIKLPHFSLKMGSKTIFGKEFSFPTGFNVDWYAKGGILTKPTAFGTNGNSLMVGGEAGREAVLPLNAKTLGGIGKGIADTMNLNNNNSQNIGDIVINLDGKEIARVTLPYTNEMNGNNIRLTGRGLAL